MNGSPKRILVMRFSALGDVAMTVPVLKSFLSEHLDIQITMLSNRDYEGLFEGIERLDFLGADMKGQHRGVKGIWRIYRMVKEKVDFTAVADLHGVLRTRILRWLFRLDKKKISVIDKGRVEKFALTRKDFKIFRPLTHSTERYHDVLNAIIKFPNSQLLIPNSQLLIPNPQSPILIGFAPFAKHNTKMYNLDRFKEVVRHFDREPYSLYFFGGSQAERLLIRQWNKEFKRAVSIKEGIGLKKEMEIISKLRLMVSMDSANMHLASLAEVPVVSIWGPTHPYAGFYGVGQNPLNAIQLNLACRPCSVFGNKACWRGDHACMKGIESAMVIEKIEEIISTQGS
jgi:ADP-heptose:LPS heptosyltransferase